MCVCVCGDGEEALANDLLMDIVCGKQIQSERVRDEQERLYNGDVCMCRDERDDVPAGRGGWLVGERVRRTLYILFF